MHVEHKEADMLEVELLANKVGQMEESLQVFSAYII